MTTFLDILGFAELIRSTPAPKIAEVLEELRQANVTHSDQYHDWLKSINAAYNLITVSDSTFRAILFDPHVEPSPSPVVHLAYEIKNLLLIQRSLIEKAILLRGGISDGDLYMTESVVFGPALVSAYHLESKFAVYPRIAIAPSLIRLLQAAIAGLSGVENRDAGQEWEYVSAVEAQKHLCRSDDGIYYINYLAYIPEDTEFDIPSFEEMIELHRELIRVKAVPSLSADLQVKYNWLSHYHNWVVKTNGELFEVPERSFEYRIGPSDNPHFV